MNWLKNFLKRIVDSTPIPRLVDFLMNKSKKEMLENAPPAAQNWERMNRHELR